MGRDFRTSLGIAVCTLLMWGLGVWAGTHYQARWSEYKEEEAKPYEGALDAASFWKMHGGRSESYGAICNSPIDQSQADLCQQWRSANAAEQMAGYALVSVIFGLVGLVGVGITVSLSNRATSAATRATRAAITANDIAQNNARIELRPYLALNPEHVSSFGPETVCVFRVRCENKGSTPALDIRRLILVTVVGHPPSPPPEPILGLLRTPTPPDGMSLASGNHINFSGDAGRVFSANELLFIRNGTARIVALIRTEYRDVFGDEHVEEAGFVVSADSATLTKLVSDHQEPDLFITFERLRGFGTTT